MTLDDFDALDDARTICQDGFLFYEGLCGHCRSTFEQPVVLHYAGQGKATTFCAYCASNKLPFFDDAARSRFRAAAALALLTMAERRAALQRLVKKLEHLEVV